MGLRNLSFGIIAASFLVLSVGDSAHAQPPTKAPGAGKPGAATPPKGTKPPEPGPLVWAVCVRPEEVEKTVNEWTFGETHKPVVSDVTRTAKFSRHPIFKFDPKASLDSPKKFPGKYRELKCPNDDRKPDAPPPPASKPFSILPPSGSAFDSVTILGSGSLASSGTGKSTLALVNQFVQTAAQFNLDGTEDEIKATEFATKLRDSITNKTTLPEIAIGDLSPEVATILAGEFGESLAAAMAKQPVIGPANVLKKMVPSGKKAVFAVFQLIDTDTFAGWQLNPPDALPSVILPIADYEQRTKTNQQLILRHLPPKMLHERFEQAYGDKPEWLASIEHFFKDP